MPKTEWIQPESMARLERVFGEALRDLLDKGFVLPIRAATLAVNGSVLVVSYYPSAAGDGSLACTVLAEHYENDGFAVPINLMYVDQRGEVATLVIEKDDGQPRFIQSGRGTVN